MTTTTPVRGGLAPLSDSIITAVARLVDDAMSERRDPSHSDIDFLLRRTDLFVHDPNTGQKRGKKKRVQDILFWAMDNAPEKGERFVAGLIASLRGCGAFRHGSPNYAGENAIRDAQDAFKAEGFALASDGELHPAVLETLSGTELTAALAAYARRAQRGVEDAALVTGTGKDLVEATAAHVLVETQGSYPQTTFDALLGMAFVAVGMTTPQDKSKLGESPLAEIDRGLFTSACGVNKLRNKQGVGHGRPWLPSVTNEEARQAVGVMGSVSARLLYCLEMKKARGF
jgi:hypothetical protein